MADRYWVGGTDTWNSTAGTKWSTTSGGAGGASVPGSADVAIFDANSGSGVVTRTITTAIQALICTGFTGTIAGSSAWTINSGTEGGVVLSVGMTWSNTGKINFTNSSGTAPLNSAGKTLGQSVEKSGNGTLQLAAGLTITGTLTCSGGTIDANGFDITAAAIDVGAGDSLALGTGTHTLTGSFGTVLNSSSSTSSVTGSGTIRVATSGSVTLTPRAWFAGFDLVFENTGSVSVSSVNNPSFRNVDFSAATGTVMAIYLGFTESVTLGSTPPSIRGDHIYLGTGAGTYDPAGWIRGTANSPSLVVNSNGGSLDLLDDLEIENFTLTRGTFNSNNHAIDIYRFSSTGTLTRALNLGTSAVTIEPQRPTDSTTTFGDPWVVSGSGYTLDVDQAPITINTRLAGEPSAFDGAGQTYNNLKVLANEQCPLVISGDNTFGTVEVEYPNALIFADGSNQTVADFIRSAGLATAVEASLPGVSGNYYSATVSNPLASSTWRFTMWLKRDDWTPPADNTLACRWNGDGGSTRSWFLNINTSGVLYVGVTPDNVNNTIAYATAAVPFADGDWGWVQIYTDNTNIYFYTSEDGYHWTQLGSAVAFAPGTPYNSPAPVEIGSSGAGTGGFWSGDVRYALMTYNAPNPIANFVFDPMYRATDGGASFVSGLSNTWNCNTSGGSPARYNDFALGDTIRIGSNTIGNTHTLTKSGGGTIGLNSLYVQDSIASPGSTWYAGGLSTDGGNNSGWIFSSLPIDVGISEGVDLADAPVGAITVPGVVSESTAGGDSASASQISTHALAETGEVSETQTGIGLILLSTSEEVDIADSLGSTLQAPVVIAEGVVLADVLAGLAGYLRAQSEGAIAGESISATALFSAAIFEDASSFLFVSATALFSAALTDSSVVEDLQDRTVSRPGGDTEESVIVADTGDSTQGFHSPLDMEVDVGEVVTLLATQWAGETIESLIAADAPVARLRTNVDTEESAQASDSLSGQYFLRSRIAEELEALESMAATQATNVITLERVLPADSITGRAQFSVSVLETARGEDAPSATGVLAPALAEIAEVLDQATGERHYALSADEGLSVADQLTLTFGALGVIAERARVAEGLTAPTDFVVLLEELAAAADSLAAQISATGVGTLELSERAVDALNLSQRVARVSVSDRSISTITVRLKRITP